MWRFPVASLISLVLAVACLEGRVFDDLGQDLSRLFHAGHDAAKIENVYANEDNADISNGERPRASLLRLAGRWHNIEEVRRQILIGNSQTFAIILAPDELVPQVPPMAYPDLVAESFNSSGGPVVYRLSAPNLSYPEALWYTLYLSTMDAVRPGQLVLQLNYESFRKSGIRDGMLDLLEEPRFAAAVEGLIAENRSYSGVLAQAVNRYHEKTTAAPSREKVDRQPRRPGARWEAELRRRLETTQLWRRKHDTKNDMLNLLYLMRVYLLKITPTTPRPLSGGAYETSVAALERIARICRDNGIVLRLFLAPQNPATPLWRTFQDRSRYLVTCRRLSEKYDVRLVDLENVIPRQQWGVWIDGPDPIHFGLQGHRLMADAMWKTGLLR